MSFARTLIERGMSERVGLVPTAVSAATNQKELFTCLSSGFKFAERRHQLVFRLETRRQSLLVHVATDKGCSSDNE